MSSAVAVRSAGWRRRLATEASEAAAHRGTAATATAATATTAMAKTQTGVVGHQPTAGALLAIGKANSHCASLFRSHPQRRHGVFNSSVGEWLSAATHARRNVRRRVSAPAGPASDVHLGAAVALVIATAPAAQTDAAVHDHTRVLVVHPKVPLSA